MSDQSKDTQWVFVAEITVAVDDAGTLQTHYACSGEGFATRPGDTPAHTAIPPTLLEPGSLRREMFSGDKPFGAVRPAFGEVSLYNGDGRYDGWEHHGFDGRDFVLRWGPLGGAYPADFVTVVICTIEGITLTETEARLKLRDNTQLLDKAFLKDAFAGGTVPEGGELQKGQVKHRYIGTPAWTGPQPQVIGEGWGNTLYHLSTGRVTSSRVWDNGNELSQGFLSSANFWNLSATVTPGYYYLLTEGGSTYLRLASRPEGDVRVFAQTVQDSGAAWSMAALLAETGYSGAVTGVPLPGFDAVVADSGVTYARLFDDAAANAGMWYGFDRLGRFVSKAFDAPEPPILVAGTSSTNDMVWLCSRGLIPFDEMQMYRTTVRMRRVAGEGRAYLGWAGVSADGATFVSTSGANSHTNAHYHAASNANPTNGEWVTYVGYTRGYGAVSGTGSVGTRSVPGKAHPLVRFMRPLMALNYNNASGISEVAEFIVEAITPGATAAEDQVTQVLLHEQWINANALEQWQKMGGAPDVAYRVAMKDGSELLTLSRSNCLSLKRSPVQGMEVPLYQLSVNSIQTWRSQYTAPVNYVREKFTAEQWINRYSHSDESRLVKHPSARSLAMDLLIGPSQSSEWEAFYTRYMRLFGVERSSFTAVLPLSPALLQIDLGDVVRVQWPRFNLSAGRLFRVIALRYALKARQLEIVLWG